MAKKHNCPFLEFSKYCTFKRPGESARPICPYNNPEKCKYHQRSKTKLKVSQNGLKQELELDLMEGLAEYE